MLEYPGTETKETKDVESFEERFKGGYVCTVVNLIPREILEFRPHMIPSTYRIPACTKEGFGLLYVGEAIHYVPDVFDEKRSFKVNTSPATMAESICNDWKSSNIALGEGAEPGLIWFEGRHSLASIKKLFSKELEVAKELQKKWYKNLIGMADADWNKNHNLLVISELQKIAASELSYQAEWLIDQIIPDLISCPFCKAKIDPESIKCLNCKEVVNQAKYDALTKGKS